MKSTHLIFHTLVKASIGTYLILRFLTTNYYSYLWMDAIIFVQYHMFISNSLSSNDVLKQFAYYWREHGYGMLLFSLILVVAQALIGYLVYWMLPG